jgi:nitrogen fixation-related uncharacterized protein
MNAYYLLWAALITASLSVSLGGFLWAYRYGQFKDQDRARFLPLRGEDCFMKPGGLPGARREAFIMLGIIVTGVSAILTVVVIALVKFHGGGL